MVYRATGVVNDREKNSIRLLCAELEENGGKWNYSILASQETAYPGEWQQQLENLPAANLNSFFRLHNALGRFIGETVRDFIIQHQLEYRVQLIGLTGYFLQSEDEQQPEAEIGNAAMVAAITGINVVSGFSDINIGLGGSGREIFTIPAQLLPVTAPDDFTLPLYVALLAVLRWREENNISAAATGASRDCTGGAVWMGQEA